MSNKQSAFRSPWVIGWLVLLLAVLAMNITMVYFSQDKFSGLVVDDAYERGKDLHENIRKRQAEKPKWKTQVEFAGAINYMGDLKIPAYNKPVKLDYVVTDQQGAPVEPQSVTFYAYRNSDAKQDFSVEMTRVESGHYQAEITFPLKGVWDTYVTATTGVGNIEHNTVQNIFVEE
jgi:nitrogen fixation protein FixH